MIMKRWRVGSLTMGLILLASGIMLLVSLIMKINIINILLTFWPIILICIGIEILLHLFIKRDDGADTKIKYDVLSILFIGFVLFISGLFYTATYSIEMLGGREDAFTILGIKHQDVYIESDVELPEADTLIVLNSYYMGLRVIQTEGDNLRVDYKISAQTNDKEYAAPLLESAIDFEHGQRAYMTVSSSILTRSRKVGHAIIECTIYLPSDKTLDLTQFHGYSIYDPILENQIIQVRPEQFDYE